MDPQTNSTSEERPTVEPSFNAPPAYGTFPPAPGWRTQRAYARAERRAQRAYARSQRAGGLLPRGVVFGLLLLFVGAMSLAGLAYPGLAAVTWPVVLIAIGGLVLVAAFVQ